MGRSDANSAREYITRISAAAFKMHDAKHKRLPLLDGFREFHELRSRFARWVVFKEKSSFKRCEISPVFKHSGSALQGDFDIIGGESAVCEAKVMEVTMDVLMQFFPSRYCDIHINHANILGAMWSWIGVYGEHRQKISKLLSMASGLRPNSPKWNTKWALITNQILQEIKLPKARVNWVVDRLQGVASILCGPANRTLSTLRLSVSRFRNSLTSGEAEAFEKAVDELSRFLTYLEASRVRSNIYIDPLMIPTESYHKQLFFQVYLMKENNPKEGALLAVGGRYDDMIRQMWDKNHKSNAPGAVGASLALESIIQEYCVDPEPTRKYKRYRRRSEGRFGILVCSSKGLFKERVALAAELRKELFKVDYVLEKDPSFARQFDYANEHNLKCLVIITKASLIKVCYLDTKEEKEVAREDLVKFLALQYLTM